MKFNEKLQNQRKANNLSQEQLAEKLEMSRQAISKWESGNSYPDMATIMKLCKILNCSLEDLIDDDAIGSNTFEKNNKFNINKWIKDLLEFITKTYNMFCSMKFKQKIKCILELSIIICLLIIFFAILGEVIFELIGSPLYSIAFLPDSLYYFLSGLFKLIYSIFAIALGSIIFIHLFKIRYLDYFVTIEDSNIKERIIEEDINVKTNKYIKEEKKEKVIIRDPKHSTYSFFSGLAKIILYIIKFFLIFILVPCAILFIVLVMCGSISIVFIKYSTLFISILISFIGLILINYDFLELIINFIFNKSFYFKKMFVLFIVGLACVGVGCGLSIAKVLSFKTLDENLQYNSESINITMKDDILFEQLYSTKEIIIDNSKNDINVKVKYVKGVTPYFYEYDISDSVYISYNVNPLIVVNNLLDDIKKEVIRNYNLDPLIIESITLSQSNYDKILDNYENYYNRDTYNYYE